MSLEVLKSVDLKWNRPTIFSETLVVTRFVAFNVGVVTACGEPFYRCASLHDKEGLALTRSESSSIVAALDGAWEGPPSGGPVAGAPGCWVLGLREGQPASGGLEAASSSADAG